MPEYLHPGVHIEEIEGGPRPIDGVPTSTAALLGEAERGPITPRLVTSYAEYQHWFGGVFDAQKFLPYATHGFFENGGARAYICRIAGSGAVSAEAAFGDFSVRAAGPGVWGTRVFAKISAGSTKRADGTSVGFRLQLAYWSRSDVTPFDAFEPGRQIPVDQLPTLTEDFDDLDSNESSPDFYGTRVPQSSALAVLVRNSAVTGAFPANGGRALTGGSDGTGTIGVAEYKAQGLAALELDAYGDVALVHAPGAQADTQKAIVEHCEALRFRFAVIDCDRGQNDPGSLDPRASISDSDHAAFYYPWITISDPHTGARALVPPGGHVLGVYARSDMQRGVLTAPADEIVRGALDLEYDINDIGQEDLKRKGVNAVRRFPGRGIRVWGARTLTTDPDWKYVNVRRFLIFLEHSIDQGTKWVVFEPNDAAVWARVTHMVEQFLLGQWTRGALVGQSPKEAFFVRCDSTTMTQDDISNGRLVCMIGVAPVRPAEFVVFRIVQQTATA